MSISNKVLLGTPPTGSQANTLLASLSADIGAGNRLGQDFSEMLRSKVVAPTVTPPRINEFAAPPKPVRAPEQTRSSEQKPAATQESKPQARATRSNEATASKQKEAKDSTASSRETDPSDATSSAQDASDVQTSAQADQTEASTSKENKRPGESDEAGNVAGLNVAAIAIADPKLVNSAPETKITIEADKLEAESHANAPQDLAKLMPSVANAVFGEGPAKPSLADGKADGKAAPTSTDERGKLLSARAQDMAALLAASPSSADTPQSELRAISAELVKSFGVDKPAGNDTPSFGKLMQTVGAVTGPFAGPANAASGSQPLAPSTPIQMKSDLQGPGFASEMAARLTVLTSAGVQQAELHLNPAEMGPVSVKIHLNGQEAQVHFHAQHALTREVLERSLPELAAALRDAGMTLTGGGVFEQSNGARQDGQAQGTTPAVHNASAANGSDETSATAAPMIIRHNQVGVLDMYA